LRTSAGRALHHNANLSPDALLTWSADFWFVLGGVLRF